MYVRKKERLEGVNFKKMIITLEKIEAIKEKFEKDN